MITVPYLVFLVACLLAGCYIGTVIAEIVSVVRHSIHNRKR